MRLGTNKAKTNETENVLRVASISYSSSKDGARFSDSIMVDVINWITVGESLILKENPWIYFNLTVIECWNYPQMQNRAETQVVQLSQAADHLV